MSGQTGGIDLQRSDGGETSIGLAYIAALLIKYGLISLHDLLPFVCSAINIPTCAHPVVAVSERGRDVKCPS